MGARPLTYPELCAQASKMGFGVYPYPNKGEKKKAKEQRSFVKLYLKVVEMMTQEDILNDAEFLFLFKVIPYCEINSNFLINRKTHHPLTIAEFCEIIGRQDRQTRSLLRSLVNKNILCKCESGFSFKYCVNPEIYWNGGNMESKLYYQRMFYTEQDMKIYKAKEEFERKRIKRSKMYVNGRATSILKEVYKPEKGKEKEDKVPVS